MTLETLQAELVAHRAALNRTMAAVMDAYPLSVPIPNAILSAVGEVREARQRVVMALVHTGFADAYDDCQKGNG